MTWFISFKNTFLLLFLLVISCGQVSCKNKTPDGYVKQVTGATKDTIPGIITGANQTDAYLPILQGKKVAVVANQTSIIFKDEHSESSYVHLVDSLLALQVNIVKVFAPEHGFRGDVDAGEHVSNSKDIKTGLPLISLYGKNRKPTAEQLADVDMVVFDIQDVGVRFYTYISTLHYVMEACAEANIPLLILDRPNPNGSYVDGPTMEPGLTSFLGMHQIPLVHGMTIAEYAKMINGEKWLKDGVQCNLKIIPLKFYEHTLPYSLVVRPSPNLPNDQAIQLYPSLGLFEGTNINAGRGTEFQFQRYGAPFLDEHFFTFTYTPVANFGSKEPKHKNTLCYGEDLSKITPPGKVSLNWIMKAYKHTSTPEKIFNKENFAKHAGTFKLQEQIEAGLTEEEIRATWADGITKFKKIRAKYLLYP